MSKQRMAFFCCLAATWALSSAVAMAAVKTWGTGNGSWNVSGNWLPSGVPVFSDEVRIVNTNGVARTVTLNVSTPALQIVSLDLTGSGTDANTLSITTNNNITAAAISIGGWNGTAQTNGRGAVIQSAGKTTISSGFDLIMGWGANSTGTYTLSGGALEVNQTAWIGYSGIAVFNHSAGTHTIYSSAVGSFTVGANAGANGTYNLNGTGSLTSFENEYIGASGTGKFTQTGGSNTIYSDLIVGFNSASSGKYLLFGGDLTVHGNEYIAYSATGPLVGYGGEMSHATGATHTVDGNVYLGFDTSAKATYGMGAGTLAVGGGLFVGHGALSNGFMTVDVGGKITSSSGHIGYGNNSQGAVLIAGAGTSWKMTGDLQVGNGGSGRINIIGGEVAVGGTLSASFYSDTYIRLDGGKLTVNQFDSTAVNVFDWRTGTLRLTTASGLSIAPSGLFGSSLLLSSNQSLEVDNMISVVNNAVLFAGGGLKAGTLQVSAGGQLFTKAGLLAGSASIAAGGQAYFFNPTPDFGSGLVNSGQLVFAQPSIVDGPINNAAGGAITALGAVTFRDPVVGPGNFFGPGHIAFDGGYAPGASPAEVSFEGGVSFSDTNVLSMEIGGTTAGSQHDKIIVGGNLALDGVLQVSFIGGFTPAAGQSFDVLDFSPGALGGTTFSSLQLPTLAGLNWDTSQLYTVGKLALVALGLPGDFNNSGTVDAADYVVWRKGLGTIYSQTDYNVWRAHFGQTAASGTGAGINVAVPEPATILMLMFATTGSFVWRKRSN